jgi:hypothetical protein
MRRIADYGDYSKTLEQRRKESKDGYVTVYRVGQVEDFKDGLFFAFDLDYYANSDTSYTADRAVEYLLDLNANIWDPIDELNLDVYEWHRIDGLTSDFEKYGIKDECDWEMSEEFSSTSTEGLAKVAKRLGYQAVYLHGMHYSSSGTTIDELAVFDKSIIERI